MDILCCCKCKGLFEIFFVSVPSNDSQLHYKYIEFSDLSPEMVYDDEEYQGVDVKLSDSVETSHSEVQIR